MSLRFTAHTHTHTHTLTHTLIHSRIFSLSHTHAHTHTRTRTHARTYTCANITAQMRNHTCTLDMSQTYLACIFFFFRRKHFLLEIL